MKNKNAWAAEMAPGKQTSEGKCFAYNPEKQECGCLTRTCSNCYTGSPCHFYKTCGQKRTDELAAMARCKALGVEYGVSDSCRTSLPYVDVTQIKSEEDL